MTSCNVKQRIYGMVAGIGALFVIITILTTSRVHGDSKAIPSVHHDLQITLHPDTHRLVGRDRMRLRAYGRSELTFYISEHADLEIVEINGAPAVYRVSRGRVNITVPTAAAESEIRLTIGYSAVFDDPYPETPVNTDNPGYGVTGIVSEKGTFLLAGAGWYPHIASEWASFRIRVDAPEGVVAVTSGRSVVRKTEGRRTISEWEIQRAVEALALSAGRYTVRERSMGEISISTYFFQEIQPLSDRYLDAVERYIEMYEALFGPYPFAKFAVVENFFPTGYGFPSYTLVGGRVLRLPFIIATSLGHEIAHCWWGNGVLVDHSTGNWSEGLTSYVADYLYQERISEQKAAEHRRQWLRNYATLVDDSRDFPLAAFRSRVDNPTKVIGYDKGAMMFHMVRQIVGETAFWGALRDIFKEKRFQKASWNDFRLAFKRRSECVGEPCLLDRFFEQWVFRKGAPQPVLEDVQRRRNSNGEWIVSGRIRQVSDTHDLLLKLVVTSTDDRLTQTVWLQGTQARFKMTVPWKPQSVELDPGADVFRRLFPSEIPKSVNSIKGAESVLMVITEQAGNNAREIAGLLAQSFGLQKAGWISESELSLRLIKNHDLVFIGFPKNQGLAAPIPSPVSVEMDAFTLGSRRYNSSNDTIFAAFPHPESDDRTAGLLFSPGGRLDVRTVMKLTHYGRYSYLAFENGQNRDRGTWPVTVSPLIFDWKEKVLK
jgi:peptidase M1-like protein